MRDITDLVRTATGQYGLLTTQQLREGGVTKSSQAAFVRNGVLEQLRPGVVCLPGAPTDWAQRLLATILTPGAAAVASHRSALRLWCLRDHFAGIEITVRYPANRTLPGVTVHRSVDLGPRDVTTVCGIPVTTVARTLCDAGLIFPDREIQRLVDHAVATDLVSANEMRAVRRRVGEHGRNGVVRLEVAVDALPDGAEQADSGPEVELVRLLIDHGLPAPTQQQEVQAGFRRYRIDISYPDAQLALEYDGIDSHTRIDRFVDDRRRQNDLVDAGWTVLRYTNLDLRDRRDALVGQVRRHLPDL